MNRANFGNIVTNGIQTLSVSGFTAAGYKKGADRARIADAASGLNNLSYEEAGMLGQAKADQMRNQIAENIENKLGDNIDNIMQDDLFTRLKSPQSKQLKQRVSSDLDWYKNYRISQNQEEEFLNKEMDKVIKQEQRIIERRKK